jgi:ABC-2 type transport system ATP-binding protein
VGGVNNFDAGNDGIGAGHLIQVCLLSKYARAISRNVGCGQFGFPTFRVGLVTHYLSKGCFKLKYFVMLTIQGLKKSFGKSEVLRGIEMQCKPGEINGIVGVNGAGKSTLFQCIIGLQKSEGTVDWTGGIIKNQSGLLPTDPPMLSRITGAEYLRLVTQARGLEIADFQNQNIFDLPLDRFVENYSTGMKKKIALTGVLLQKNDIFILDEPFNGLDLQSNLIVVEIIRKLKSMRKIILISSHIFSLLKDICDQVHYLKDGRIDRVVSSGDFDQLEAVMTDANFMNRVKNLDL